MGRYVVLAELKDTELPAAMKRAMTRQAEAGREKRAKIVAPEGEALSADRLTRAADVISDHPIALQLCDLQILAEITAEKDSVIV
jgi:regulator of protease activity HflC (stomatin/prohibitin superfamily)